MVHFEKCNDCCVWMDAGVLSYKRCDRNFDCEHCPLDSVLQSEIPDTLRRTENYFEYISVALPEGVTDDAAALLAPYASTVLQRDFSYTDEHIWVQALPGGYFRVGLDAWYLRLMPNATDVITLASGSAVPESGPLGWIYMDGATYTMRSPVTGVIVRRNASINRVNDGMRGTPYSESWLAVIKAHTEDARLSGACMGMHAAAGHIREDMGTFIGSAAAVLGSPEHLGALMNDGGTRMVSLEQALGDRVYRDIVLDILHMEKK